MFRIFFAIAFFNYNYAFANPSPLNIKLNEATLKDVKEKYKITKSLENANDGYMNHTLDTKHINMDGLSKATIISNSDNKIESVILTFDTHKSKEIFKNLNEKYNRLKSSTSLGGIEQTKFEDDESYIVFDDSFFKLEVTYVTKSFYTLAHKLHEAEETAKKEQTKSLL